MPEMSRAEFRRRSAALRKKFPGLRLSGAARSSETNAKNKGKALSKHLPEFDMAHDFVGSKEEMAAAEAWAKKMFPNAQVHDAGSGLHLHIQGLAAGRPTKAWIKANPPDGSGPKMESREEFAIAMRKLKLQQETILSKRDGKEKPILSQPSFR